MTQKKKHSKLNEIFSTAICGNDILSSALYVSGIAILYSGVLAPLVLALVVVVLYLYKKVYIEVVEALPVNGGAYNCLLNGTSKDIAAIAGVMTILSYMATAVISGKVGVDYLFTLLPHNKIQLFGYAFDPIIFFTVVLLFGFAILVVTGLKDSAVVALTIFIIHIITLVSFLGLGAMHLFYSGGAFFMGNIQKTFELAATRGGVSTIVFLAFAAAMLGVSGFESSANFVEEQKRGVFRKTLRNMLVGVAIFNPLIALVVLGVMPYDKIITATDFLLANAAFYIGGDILKFMVSVDAFLVLSGAVLTSFVGVSGLIHRMAADSCLPNFLTYKTKKDSFPFIVFGFFILCASILVMTGGDLLSLAGVYTISFLGVMSLFALGNIILKETRSELKRTYTAPITIVFLALVSTLVGIYGNIKIDEKYLQYFGMYFIPSILLVYAYIYQDRILKSILRATRRFPHIHYFFFQHFESIVKGEFVVFLRGVEKLHEILSYIDRNETGWNIYIVHCGNGAPSRDKDYQKIRAAIPLFRDTGVFPHFNIRLMYLDRPFTPGVITDISKKLHVPQNRMMIGSINQESKYDYEDLGGVRIIF